MSTPSAAEVMAVVRLSPALVAVHDKSGWLDLFSSDHVVEDPVGSRPVPGTHPGDLRRFWDAFIAPNQIEFEVANDWVDGFEAVRDVVIVTTLRPGVMLRTPAHLLYETVFENGVLKVRRMAAHWEPRGSYRQLMRPSRAHLRAAMVQFAHLIRTLGIGQTAQFVGAARFIGWRRKRRLRAELGTSVARVIVSGRSTTATFTANGSPAAMINGKTYHSLA